MSQRAWEFCHAAGIGLTPEGQALLRADLAVRPYLDQLMQQGCYADARRILAHALPRPWALLWGCLCARDLYQPGPPDAAEVIEVVSRYATTGDESSRRQAGALGMQFGANELTCCLAMAAFFAGDNVSAPDLPAITPHPRVTGRLVEVVVYLASVRKDPARYKDCLRRYLEQGLQLAAGPGPWQSVAQGSRPALATATPLPAAYAGGTP